MMPDLSTFPITKRWPAKHPDRLQLYSLPTPNGVKVSIMLEEIGLPYEAHLVDFNKDDQKTPEFLSLNPNGKIPAILDPTGPAARRCRCSNPARSCNISPRRPESCCPPDAARRYETIQWVHFPDGRHRADVRPGRLFLQIRGAGSIDDKRPLERYVAESKRLLGVMEARLNGRQWIMDDEYTIADISMLGWVRNLIGFYGARELVAFDAIPQRRDLARSRPGAARGATGIGDPEAAVSADHSGTPAAFSASA